MHVEFYEKVFLGLTLAVMAVLMVAVGNSVTRHGIHLPEPAARVDPTTLEATAPWNAPGVTVDEDGTVRVTMVAAAWSYRPNEITVPTGATVVFEVSTPDVIHGLKVLDTNINAMVIPGQVSRVVHTFDEPGEHLIVCHEYCGIGHQAMFGTIVVADGAVPGPAPEQPAAQADAPGEGDA